MTGCRRGGDVRKLDALITFWLFGLPVLIGLLAQSVPVGLVVFLLNPVLWVIVWGAFIPAQKQKTDRILHRYGDWEDWK